MDGHCFDIIVALATLVVLTFVYVKYSYGYWKRRNIPYLEPTFPFGNTKSLAPKGIAIGAITCDFYNEFKKRGCQIGGVYVGLQPKLLVLDPTMIKDILVRDFQYFTDRGIYMTESDPITVNIFAQKGQQWRNIRTKMTAVFTTAKMKQMFQTMLDCTEGLKQALEMYSEQKSDVDMLETTACFTTDVIGSCTFGVVCNSFKDPDAEFRRMGRKLFTEHKFMDRLNLFLSIYFPNLSQKIGVRNIQKDVSRFFFNSIRDTVNHREKNDIKRNDLLQLLIDLKNSEEDQLTENEVIAQVFLFFVAGFETSSSTSTWVLFEISKNEEVQTRLREEILEVLSRHGNQITYDALAEMKLLGQAIDETLRMWPPVTTLTRVCTKDYKFDNTNIGVEKGTTIMISTLGLHHDPDYWPEPSKWDPDRFSEENKESRMPFTYLPFGEGPRNCIGLRFGLLQTKIALVTVLSKYRVSLSPRTVLPLGIDVETFVLYNINKVYLRLEKIKTV